MKENGLRLLRWGGTLVSSALFVWLISRQDWRDLWNAVREMNPWLLPLAAGLYFTAILFNTLRWFLLLRVQNVSVRYFTLLQIVLSGNFASNFLPSTVGGDSVRVVSTSQIAGWAIGLASVVVDRLLNLVAMATLLPFSWLALHPLVGLSAGQAGVSLYGGVLPALRTRLATGLWKIRVALGLWGEHKGVLFLGIGISWLARLSVFSGVWLLARGLGITVALWQVIGVGAFTNLLSLVPVSINSLGLREVTMTALYVQLGATLEQASALSVVTRAILMLETLPGALWVTRALQVVKQVTVPEVDV